MSIKRREVPSKALNIVNDSMKMLPEPETGFVLPAAGPRGNLTPNSGVPSPSLEFAGRAVPETGTPIPLPRAPARQLQSPHPVYELAVADLATPEKAKMVGWRYVVLENGVPTAVAEIKSDEAGKPGKFSHFNQGRFVQATEALFRWCETQGEVASRDYELRLLRITSLNFLSVWLWSEEDNLYVRFDAAGNKETRKLQRWNEIRPALEASAKKLREAGPSQRAHDATPRRRIVASGPPDPSRLKREPPSKKR